MRYVSASAAKQGFAAVLDAAQREPVVIRRQKRDVAVVLSMAEYEKLTRLNAEAFQRFCDRIGARGRPRPDRGEARRAARRWLKPGPAPRGRVPPTGRGRAGGTNALVSRLLLPRSVPAQAVRRAVEEGRLLVSDATLGELAEVLARAKFDAYVSVEERQEFLRLLGRIAELVPILHRIRACRDPKDDKFLEVAVNGGADLIVSGDRDLLETGTFRGIPVLGPAAYLRS